MRNITLYLLIITLLTPIAISADYSTIYNSWSEYNTTTSQDGKEFHIRLDPNSDDRVRVTIPATSTVTRLNDCSRLNQYRVCYENKSMDRNLRIDQYGQLRPGINIRILKDEGDRPKARVNLDYKKQVKAYQENRILVEMQNVNSNYIPIVRYEMDLQGLNAEDGDTYKKETSIGKNEEKIVDTVWFEPEQAGNYTIPTKLVYGIEGQLDTVEDAFTIEVINPYRLTHEKIDNNAIEMTLTNNKETNLTAQLQTYNKDAFSVEFDKKTIQDEQTFQLPINQTKPGTQRLDLKFQLQNTETFTENITYTFTKEPKITSQNQSNQGETTSQQQSTPNNNTQDTPDESDEQSTDEEEDDGILMSLLNWWKGIWE